MHFRFHRRRASTRHVRHLPGLQHRSYPPQMIRRTFGQAGEEASSENGAGRLGDFFEQGKEDKEGEEGEGPRGRKPCDKMTHGGGRGQKGDDQDEGKDDNPEKPSTDSEDESGSDGDEVPSESDEGDDGIPTTPPAEPAPTLTDEADDSLSTPPAEPADPIEPTDLADEPVDEPIDDGSSEQADVSVLPADAQAQPQDMGAPGIAQEAGSSSMKSEGNSSAGLIAGIAAGAVLLLLLGALLLYLRRRRRRNRPGYIDAADNQSVSSRGSDSDPTSFGNTGTLVDEKQSIGYPTELDLDGRETTYTASQGIQQSYNNRDTMAASTVFQPRTTMFGADSIANPQPLPVRKDSIAGSTHFGRHAPSGFQ